MSLFQLPTTIYTEAFMGFLLWWFAIYLLSKNPLERVTQLLFLIFASIGFYLTSDVFFVLSNSLHQYQTIGLLLKLSTWSIYLPYALIFHLSYLIQRKKSSFDKVILYFVYLLTILVIILEAGTNLIRNYGYIASNEFIGYIPSANGKYFWIIGISILISLAFTLQNFVKLLLKEKKYATGWWKYFWPAVAITLNILAGPFIILSYYGMVPHSEIVPISLFIFTALLFAYSVIKYRLFIEDPKLIFGKNLVYSTIIIIIIEAFIIAVFTTYPLIITHTSDLLMPVLITYFIAACLPIYNWLSTFINDLQFNVKSGLSVVNDADIYNALKSYNNPEKLEESSLLNLNLVKYMAKKDSINSVDSLRKIIREAVDYFQSDDERRTKLNLKYHFLKMFVFDQAEEGQILWELGFEDYPLSIMTREGKSRPPKFKEYSPAEYSYISRNAFIALKKEAIHDITWRISYLEKLSRRKMF